MLERNGGRAILYATGPTRSVIWYGPMKFGVSFLDLIALPTPVVGFTRKIRDHPLQTPTPSDGCLHNSFVCFAPLSFWPAPLSPSLSSVVPVPVRQVNAPRLGTSIAEFCTSFHIKPHKVPFQYWHESCCCR